jgi:hypothetical protein
MDTRAPKVVLALMTTALVAFASSAAAQAPAAMMGTWKLNTAKSKFTPGPAPKSTTLVYAPAPEGRISIVVDVTPAEGAAMHWESVVADDGKDYPLKGNPNADSISYKRVDALTGTTTWKKDGKVTGTNTRKLSADGKTLTITSEGTTPDGKPRIDVQVFEK